MTVVHATRRVLVAEDQTGMRTLVHRILDMEEGIEVVAEATTGQEVLDRVAEFRPDTVVLDLGLPVVDGEAVLAGLRHEYPDMTVLVLSGQASAIVQPRLARLGADAVIEKGAAHWDQELLLHVRAAARA